MKNLERFKSDLKALIDLGSDLKVSLIIKVKGPDKVAEVMKVQRDTLKKFPSFNASYEAWYSECIPLIRHLLPDRLQDFRGHFEIPKNRKDITYASYRIQDALRGLRVTRQPLDEVVADLSAALPHFEQQLAILKAAEKRFESSLFEIRQLVQADLFDAEIGSARELLKSKFLRAAGAVAGVVLEKHLRQVCEDHAVKIHKKNPTISDLSELLRGESIIDMPQWRHISMLADIRNLCDHNKQRDPSEQHVTDLIDGTDKVLKTIA
jgi:hypothetical protein